MRTAGTLLDRLFPGAFSTSYWICFMALMCLPECLIPTLKEGAGAAFAGCAGTLIADVIGVAVVMHGMRGHPTPPSPDIKFSQVAGMFGNLALAYNAGIVIPALQRQHSEPTRMLRVVFVTMAFISCLFLVLASTAYTLPSPSPSSSTRPSTLPSAWSSRCTRRRRTTSITLSQTDGKQIQRNEDNKTPQSLTYQILSKTVQPQSTPNKDVINEDRQSSKVSYISNADAENPYYGDIEAELRSTVIRMRSSISFSASLSWSSWSLSRSSSEITSRTSWTS
ncbi:unnamed protein product [Phytophthora fragariaefolia]|uniref:Unnamed protein product n=1 Tax=Phytophthora fragariaefolia TaxID=1490495 RepID=A0A9W7DBF3_9STRA|nr:unnamed protein product [Phytophthora fragariaefolia]